MPLTLRLRGLAETFVEELCCPNCGTGEDPSAEENFDASLTIVTVDGIVAVLECRSCKHAFVPENQRRGIISSGKLRDSIAAEQLREGKDPVRTMHEAYLIAEMRNAKKVNKIV